MNAIRTSHNMPARQLVQLCDEMGLLVDSEAFDMWEKPKTEFDNHRFFTEHAERDVRSLDRARPQSPLHYNVEHRKRDKRHHRPARSGHHQAPL